MDCHCARGGARHALIGPNGAGKTTFVNLLTGVLAPTAGRIFLYGEEITGMAPWRRVRRGLARTFQITQLFADMTPRETIGLAVAERQGVGGDPWRPLMRYDISAEVAGIGSRFGLADVMGESASKLPYGKRRLLKSPSRSRAVPAYCFWTSRPQACPRPSASNCSPHSRR
jgi:branched-chain amino acid transport system ATP-binding protein